MRRLREKLASKRGFSGQYVSFLIVFLMLMVIIATAVEVAGVFTVKKGIEDMATETARYIELRGAVGGAVNSEFARLKSVTGVDAEFTVDGDFSSGGKLQLEAPFTVTVTAEGHLFYIDIPLVAKATGRSEVYHK